MKNKTLLLVLIILNSVVLLGQLWPAGAPPFTRAVNVIFLIMTFLFFAAALTRLRKGE